MVIHFPASYCMLAFTAPQEMACFTASSIRSLSRTVKSKWATAVERPVHPAILAGYNLRFS